MTDADVALDGERERKPDARVTGRVGERAPVRQPVVLVGRRQTTYVATTAAIARSARHACDARTGRAGRTSIDHATSRPLQQ